MVEPIIRLDHLTRKFGEFTAVDDISFEVKTGEILGFLGPNGAGKTTTMKAIVSYISPNSGSVEVGGISVMEHADEVKKYIGYLPENNPLYEDMPVLDYLYFVAELQDIPKARIKSRILEMVKTCGLDAEKHKKIGELSKGYKQRVGLAQALIHDPQVLILDEPTSGLDPNQIVEIRELIRNIGKEKTVILSSHILAEVEAINSFITEAGVRAERCDACFQVSLFQRHHPVEDREEENGSDAGEKDVGKSEDHPENRPPGVSEPFHAEKERDDDRPGERCAHKHSFQPFQGPARERLVHSCSGDRFFRPERRCMVGL